MWMISPVSILGKIYIRTFRSSMVTRKSLATAEFMKLIPLYNYNFCNTFVIFCHPSFFNSTFWKSRLNIKTWGFSQLSVSASFILFILRVVLTFLEFVKSIFRPLRTIRRLYFRWIPSENMCWNCICLL